MIEWDEIQRIDSKLSFTVETRAVERYFGTLPQSSEDGSLVVRGRLGSRTLVMAEVVKIEQNGAYYEQQQPAKAGGDPTYKVVAPPIGATVQTLPKDAKKSTIGGIDYYLYAGTYYQVLHSGSSVVYQVVKDPTA